MNPAVEFLNHGILPFTGREKETEGLLRFCTGGFDNRELRFMLVSGEAGVGKSRLLEETLGRLEDAGVLPLHVRVYPDTAVSVISLLASELNRSPASRQLLREDVESGLGPMLRALRRLSSLRLIVLVIEDVHLLSGEHLAEFARFCSALFNEPITIIAAARPLGSDVRAAIDPYLVDEIALRGFDRESIGSLWHAVAGSPLPDDLADELNAATAGNPLAVRSALRGAFRKGLVDIHGDSLAGGRYSRAEFAEIFRQGAVRFGEGLAVHLTDEEREGLTALSWLGEVVSREAAESMLGDDAERLTDALRFKGMLAESTGVAEPVQVRRSEFPLLVFTHSLVHRQFLEASAPDVDPLLRLLASGAPLYSRLPIELVSSRIDSRTVPTDVLEGAFIQIRHVAAYADYGLGWRDALGIHAVAEGLFERWMELFDRDSREYWEAWLHVHRTGFSRRQAELLPDLISGGMEMTAGRDGERWMGLRLTALHYSCMIDSSEEHLQLIFDEVRDIVARFPALRGESAFVQALRFIALRAAGDNNWEQLRAVEREVDTAAVGHDKRWGYDHMLLCIALAYDTPEEFASREALYRRLETPGAWRDMRGLYPLSRWLFDAGYLRRLLDRIDGVISLYRTHGSKSYVVLNQGVRVIVRYLTGAEGCDPLVEMEEIPFEEIDFTGEERRFLFTLLTDAALIASDMELARTVRGRGQFRAAHAVLLGDNLGDCMPRDPSGPEEDGMLYRESGQVLRVVHALLSGDRSTYADVFRTALAMHVLRIDDPPELLALFHLADRTSLWDDPDGSDSLRDALERLLAFYADPQRSMHIQLRHLLDRYGEKVGKERATYWRGRLYDMEQARERTRFSPEAIPERRVRLRVIGDFSVTAAGEREPRRIKGERVCACLGALVAERLLRRDIDAGELRRLATGENDPERARKIFKVALFRTRETIGSDSIISDDRGVRFDPDVVSVDLLEMVDDVEAAESALAKGSLGRAGRYAARVSETFGGEVMFPTLYDSVFEAIRDELEARIRALHINLVDRLLEEGDPAAAESILLGVLKNMPEDEELGELLQTALKRQGFLAEAELVRRGQESGAAGEE